MVLICHSHPCTTVHALCSCTDVFSTSFHTLLLNQFDFVSYICDTTNPQWTAQNHIQLCICPLVRILTLISEFWERKKRRPPLFPPSGPKQGRSLSEYFCYTEFGEFSSTLDYGAIITLKEWISCKIWQLTLYRVIWIKLILTLNIFTNTAGRKET